MPVEAQTVRRSNLRRSRVVTPYMMNQFHYMRPVTPIRTPVTRPTLPPVSGPVERYSDIEYGEIVKMTVEAARANTPSGPAGAAPVSIVSQTTETINGETAYYPIATTLTDVLNRGIFVLPTNEEMRLRGVIIPSTSDTNDIRRLYSREAIQTLRQITDGQQLYVLLDNPLRDSDGRLLGTVILANGLDVNRFILQRGLGTLRTEDFDVHVDYEDLKQAQEHAQKARLGVWSQGF